MVGSGRERSSRASCTDVGLEVSNRFLPRLRSGFDMCGRSGSVGGSSKARFAVELEEGGTAETAFVELRA